MNNPETRLPRIITPHMLLSIVIYIRKEGILSDTSLAEELYYTIRDRQYLESVSIRDLKIQDLI